MKKGLLSCLGLLLWSQIYSQNLDQIIQQYQHFDSTQMQEKVYVQTDRALYKPGDNVWFNAFVTNASDAPSQQSEEIYAEFYNPKGALVQRLVLPNVNGRVRGHFLLANSALGGQYKIRVYSYWMQNFSKENYFEKIVTIQKNVLPEVLMKMDFEREAYGPGDKVTATFEARTKENQPLAGKTLRYSVQLAGELIYEANATTNSKGAALVSFDLPKHLATHDNLVNVQFEHEGLTESIARSAPIVLKNLDIQLLPEGGNLISNYPARVALKVLNEFGKPADIEGQIIDEKGAVICAVKTYHQGMGAFEFVPQKNKKYRLEILTPVGIKQKWNLPEAEDNKIGLYCQASTDQALAIDIYSPKEQKIAVIAQQKGAIIYTQNIDAKEGVNSLRIPTLDLPVGIVQITIFDAQQQPHAERLVFVNKDRNLQVTMKTHKESYAPRELVKMDISVTDELGKGVAGNFSMAVVDDKQHVFTDDKQDDILSYLLMSSELKGKVYEPNFYFDKTEEKADKALDYVMLTHGWRRFEWKEVLASQEENVFAYSIRENEHEISGYLKIGDNLAKNQTIYLSEEQPRYTKKKALATTETDENGFFKFKNVKVNFPAFVSANFHGEFHAIPILNYSTFGLESASATRYAYKDKSSYLAYYVEKEQGVEIKGKIIQKSTFEALPFASISLQQNGKIAKKHSTDYEGNFSMSVPEGVYQLEMSSIGYKTLRIDSFVINKEKTIFLEADLGIEQSHVVVTTGIAVDYGSASADLYVAGNTRLRKRMLSSPNFNSGNNDSNRRPYEVLPENSSNIEGKKLVIQEAKETKTITVRSDTISNYSYQWSSSTESERLELESGRTIVTDGTTIEQDALVVNAKSLESIPVTDKNLSSLIQYTAGVSRGRRIDPAISNRYNVNSGETDDGLAFKKEENSLFLEQIAPQKKKQYSSIRKFYEPNYAKHQTPEQRTDFRKTIYWNPILETNEKGKASVSFYNSDEITTFRAILEGNSASGQLAHQELTYHSILPFSIITKIPTVLSFGDMVRIPVVLKNNMNKELKGTFTVHAPEQLQLLKELPTEITIPADTHQVIYLDYKVAFEQGKGRLEVAFSALKLRDAIREEIEITPKGFPVTYVLSGQEMIQTDTFYMDKVYEGSLESELTVYPNILDDMMDGVSSMLNSPSGCFEQVSSSNYPNILALQLMEQTDLADVTFRNMANDYLKTGYQKLAAYEIIGGGFEWYGRLPAHEGLSAYGLVQFHDMQKVYADVQPAIIERTKDYLLRRRDGEGGFKQLCGKYGFSGNKPALFNAYITWALSEVKTKGIDKEIEAMTKEAIQSEDLYRMSLAALTHFNIGNEERAENLLKNIQQMVLKTGLANVKAESSVTYSYGNALNLETLSFVALAMMKSKERNEGLLVDIVKHILSKRQYGRFGSTQSTIMALKVLSAYYQNVSKVKESGTLLVYLNNKLVKKHDYTKDNPQKISIKGLHQHFVEGQNILTIKFEGAQNALPYSFNANWTASTPTSHPDCPLKMETQLSQTQTKVGESVRLEVNLQNLQDQALPSTMAVIGIPAGLSVQAWQLKEMQENQAFGFYELKDNYLILYYSEMDASEQKRLSFDLKTEVPGVYTAPASTTYLYYGEEYKYWSAGTSVLINE